MNISQEQNDLEQRRTDLHSYLQSDEFRALPTEVQNWRRMQEGAMEQYSKALAELVRLSPPDTTPEQPNAAPEAPVAQERPIQPAMQKLEQRSPLKAEPAKPAAPKRLAAKAPAKKAVQKAAPKVENKVSRKKR